MLILSTFFVVGPELPFNDRIPQLLYLVLFFGLAIISLSYLVSTAFRDQKKAAIWNVVWQVLILAVAPVALYLS